MTQGGPSIHPRADDQKRVRLVDHPVGDDPTVTSSVGQSIRARH